ncbi:MAG TPA: electron transport complex subunit RsxC [Candidatus Gemmiger excrementigallinarum]|uniref:Ion-translocating oxidoreductase complex subunit C n=1 Tax=Candidatus Gemmiger excrementigallinarum TaxID=2838609 RepID=A0A9D2J9W5_9FIRM|nr:electron transport complex subunit RsxC [Candidatus Gemmiger excrementigallinarum]
MPSKKGNGGNRLFKSLKRSAKGASVPHVKATAGQPTVKMPVPEHVIIPMSMHIGAPAEPVVKKGDTVMVGTLIGKAAGFVSANIHSSVSGTVQDVAPMRMVNGAMTTAIAIKTDGQQTVDPACVPPTVTDKASLLAAIQACGLVGVGGAGFPTHVKLAADTIDTLLINAAECEPYLTTDCREMLECSDTIISGITAVMKYCNIPTCIIGIERNKPECIDQMNSLVRGMPGVSVKPLPTRYPQGAEKTLVETCTGREVPQVGPSGKPGLPADVGCVIMNVTSVSTLGKFLKTGMPLTTKRVTVEGDAIAKPQNVEVPIGTLYRDVIEACGGIKSDVELGKIVFGGPMMGGAAPSADFPVLKQNNGLLLFSKKAAALPEASACIRCGRCIDACPMGLEPVVVAESFNNKDFDALKARCVDLCVACGSCSYACPAKRPVSQTMTLAKAWYMAELRKGGK